MQSQNKFFDDLAKVLNGLAGTMAGVGREAEASARERAKEWFGGMDFVSREEFDAVKDMAATARAEADALKKRVEALEKDNSKPTINRKPTTKRTTVSKTAASANSKARKSTATRKTTPKSTAKKIEPGK